jgi:hypothetical protein
MHMTGVTDNFTAEHEMCAARIMPGGNVLTVLDHEGTLQVLKHSCSQEDFGSFMSMDPDREVSYVYEHLEQERKGKYSLTKPLLLFVEHKLMRDVQAKHSYTKEEAAAYLLQKGVTVGTGEEGVIMHTANPAGLAYILRKARHLRSKMPIFSTRDVKVQIVPDIVGGWRGLPKYIERNPSLFVTHSDTDINDVVFVVDLHIDMRFVAPNAQHERVESFMQIVNAERQRRADEEARRNPPPPPPVVEAPLPSIYPTVGGSEDPLMMVLRLAANTGSNTSLVDKGGKGKGKGKKKGARDR